MSWIDFPKPGPTAKLRLFCFPYAGGSARVFRPWANHFSDAIEVCPVELPGRGQQVKQPLLTDLPSLVTVTAIALEPYLDKPFVLFGHSMGALLAFEVARFMRKTHNIEPSSLIISGRRPPQWVDSHPPTYNLPDSELIEKLRWLKGTSRAALEDPELMTLLLPIFRADFSVCETYIYQAQTPLSCPIIALGGWSDPATRHGALRGWREHTSGRFIKKSFPGHHFFIHTAQTRLLKFLDLQLQQLCTAENSRSRS
ncbi:MAG: alpha/beta fold hydrolase [Cyanobacteriota bacterium]|nr:alpha/beta fold hydrolase [Cyanobacteriota bacterium]